MNKDRTGILQYLSSDILSALHIRLTPDNLAAMANHVLNLALWSIFWTGVLCTKGLIRFSASLMVEMLAAYSWLDISLFSSILSFLLEHPFDVEERGVHFIEMRLNRFLHIIHPLQNFLVWAYYSLPVLIVQNLNYCQRFILTVLLRMSLSSSVLYHIHKPREVTKNSRSTMSLTSSCISSQTKLRSAREGWVFPSRKSPFPWSQKDSSVRRDANRTFSASAAAGGLVGKPNAGASAVLKTYPAGKRE
nr:hypothetical protein Iba_chr13fCG7270 [Ipomoea batatas]